MSISVPITSNPPEAGRPLVRATAAEIDTSASIPLYGMFLAGIFWVVLASLLGLLASVKLHAPAMLASIPALTYGRLVPAQNALFLYGFAAQVGFAVAVWLVARLGRAAVVSPLVLAVGAILWNCGVLIGAVAILSGDWTGLHRFEMPVASAAPLFVGYMLIGLTGLLTLRNRVTRDLYPSLWFALAAFFWFPWIHATASYLLHFGLLRGSAVPVIAGWYGQNFVGVTLVCLAAAATYYFVPKLSGRPLASEGMAVFGFWSLLVIAPFGGFQATYSVPRWIVGMSVISNILILIPVAAHVLNWSQTLRAGGAEGKKGSGLGYFRWGGLFFALTGLLTAWSALPSNNTIVGFTWFQAGLSQALEYGFIGLTLLGAVTVITPKLVQAEWPMRGFLKIHFRLSVAGVLVMVLPLLLGGWVQGHALADVNVPFMEAAKRVFPFVATSTLGILFFAAGQLVLLTHLLALAGRAFLNCCNPSDWMAVKGGAR